ncbi:MAG: ATP-binding protein [Oscillospiraceae bacterium]|jgi:anti-sigma regulatory factor (Ser/Thr protein kinase)
MRELSLHVMDITQNSISAGASLIDIAVEENTEANTLSIRIEDNGKGMSVQQVEQVQDPFYTTRTTRKVGLGIPFFRMAAQMTGGNLSIRSQQGVGTWVEATFFTDHIDMVPLGNMQETILLLILTNPHLDFTYTRTRNKASFTLDTRKLREILGEGIPLNDPQVVAWLKDYLAQGEAEVLA